MRRYIYITLRLEPFGVLRLLGETSREPLLEHGADGSGSFRRIRYATVYDEWQERRVKKRVDEILRKVIIEK